MADFERRINIIIAAARAIGDSRRNASSIRDGTARVVALEIDFIARF